MLRGEQSLRVLDSEISREIFGPQNVEVRGGWRKLRNEELNAMYTSSHILSVMKIKQV
jgi:hypothetical protein